MKDEFLWIFEKSALKSHQDWLHLGLSSLRKSCATRTWIEKSSSTNTLQRCQWWTHESCRIVIEDGGYDCSYLCIKSCYIQDTWIRNRNNIFISFTTNLNSLSYDPGHRISDTIASALCICRWFSSVNA